MIMLGLDNILLFKKKLGEDLYHEKKSEFKLGGLNGYSLSSVMQFNSDKSKLFQPFGKN